MKIDVEKLEKSIDSMLAVCDKGKREIKEMLSEGFGVEFKRSALYNPVVKTGDRFKRENRRYLVANVDNKKYTLIDIVSGGRYSHCYEKEYGQTLCLSDLLKSTDTSEFTKC